jgi:hypothetical protein
MIIDDAGNVGIGTITPGAPLTINNIEISENDYNNLYGYRGLMIKNASSITNLLGTALIIDSNSTTNSGSRLVYSASGTPTAEMLFNPNNDEFYFKFLGTPSTSGGDVNIRFGATSTERFNFRGDGYATADVSWSTFSPYLSYNYIEETKTIDDYPLGTMVSLSSQSRWTVTESENTNQDSIYGVIVRPEGFVSIPKELKNQVWGDDAKNIEDLDNVISVAHLGEASTMVTTKNGNIGYGDMLTASSISSFAQKATQAGRVLGSALESTDHWNSSSCQPVQSVEDIVWPEDDGSNPTKPCFVLPDGTYVGKIMVFVNVSWYNPDLEQDLVAAIENQDIRLDDVETALATLDASHSALSTEFNNFKDSLATSFSSALINTQKLVADQIEVGGQALDQYIKSVVQLAINNNELDLSQSTTESSASGTLEATAEAQPTMLSELIIENDLGETVASIDNQGNARLEGDLEVSGDLIASGSSRLGQLLAEDATVSSLLADNINTSTISAQEAKIAQAEIDHAQMNTASISGELYAQNINTDNLHTSNIDADIINGLQERLEEAVAQQLADATLLASLTNDSTTTEEYLEQTAAEMDSTLDASTTDSTLETTDTSSMTNTIMAYSAYIDSYFEVNGSALIKEGLAVGQTLMVGNGLTMGDGYIAYQSETSNDLAIQPAGRGRLSLMADLMTLDESGLVTINGDLKVAGAMEVDEELRVKDTLLTNLISANDPNADIQVQLAQATTNELGEQEIKESNFEFIDESGTPIATMSASGDLSLTGALKVEQQPADSTQSATLNNKSAGQAVILADETSATIRTSRLSENSMIYITPLGSTKNQVIYVKSKLLDSEFTEENEAEFSVGFDFALEEDVYFNWWLVN